MKIEVTHYYNSITNYGKLNLDPNNIFSPTDRNTIYFTNENSLKIFIDWIKLIKKQ